MTKAEDLEMAGEFASSMRGRYIMAKALHYAIRTLEKVEGPRKEVSDIDDMKYLRDNLYHFPVDVLDEGIRPLVVQQLRAFEKGANED